MTTADGRLVTQHNLGVPTPRDLATSLGRVPRYVGHTRIWWTVLHHVAHVYRTLERYGDVQLPREAALHVLLHDSEESILGDLPTPWKGDDRRALEDRLCRRIRQVYSGKHGVHVENVWEDVLIEADRAVLLVEMTRLGPPRCEHNSGLAYIADPSPKMSTAAALAYPEVLALKHDPFEPAESELGLWFLRTLESAVGNPAHWKLLCQVAPS